MFFPEINIGIRLMEEAAARSLDLPKTTWRQKLVLGAAAVAALAAWHVYRFGWNRLLDPSLASESLFVLIGGWLLGHVVDWLYLDLPYMPLRRHTNDTWRP